MLLALAFPGEQHVPIDPSAVGDGDCVRVRTGAT